MDKEKAVRKACEITDNIMAELLNRFSDFKTESDVMKFLRKEIKKEGVKFSFPPIIASGKRAYTLHYKPGNKRLLKGFCVLDIGVKYKGYCSDMTRTVYIGKISKKEKELYEKVLRVQLESIKKVKAGADGFKIHKEAKKKLGRRFIHGIGHGIGKKVHDKPLFKKDKFKEGDCVTIEPGLYWKNKYGIRIEDTVIVKKNGCEVLTKTSKKLVFV